MRHLSMGRLQALITNIRQGRKDSSVANTLAYFFILPLMKKKKSFITLTLYANFIRLSSLLKVMHNKLEFLALLSLV